MATDSKSNKDVYGAPCYNNNSLYRHDTQNDATTYGSVLDYAKYSKQIQIESDVIKTYANYCDTIQYYKFGHNFKHGGFVICKKNDYKSAVKIHLIVPDGKNWMVSDSVCHIFKSAHDHQGL